MPEMHFQIEWPDGVRERCYSPSLVIKEYFAQGESYALDDFMRRGRIALGIASERVRLKFGMPCGLAIAQLARLERAAQRYDATPEPQVAVLAFDE